MRRRTHGEAGSVDIRSPRSVVLVKQQSQVEAGSVDISEGNAGVRPSSSKAALPVTTPQDLQFLLDWLADVEPDKQKRIAMLTAALVDLRKLGEKHTALVCALACYGYLGVIRESIG